jgi:predicted amidohydrolase
MAAETGFYNRYNEIQFIMKICAAQTSPVKGDIRANLQRHKELVVLAATQGAGMIIFPELSVTGYEPELAKHLAVELNDGSLNELQEASNNYNIIIGAGMPLNQAGGIEISLVIFQPNHPSQVYAKQHLHPDEYPFFTAAKQSGVKLVTDAPAAAFAICYEISIPSHSEQAYKNGASVYIASVAKTVHGVEKAAETLAGIAKKYRMTVLMANCTGHCDNFDCGGKSSAWHSNGLLAGQLSALEEGLLMIDTDTGAVTTIPV